MSMRKIAFWPALLVALLFVPLSSFAQDAPRRGTGSVDGAKSFQKSQAKKSAKKSSRRSFRKLPDADADMSRPEPTTTENALTIEPNIPGVENEGLARGRGERPSTD